MTFARSIDPIFPLDHSIVGPAQNQSDVNRADRDSDALNYGTMGRKSNVPYGLYRAHGFFNPHFAKDTGVTADDLEVLWQALQNMWDIDRSSSRGMLAGRGLYVFSHESSLGNAPAHTLFECIDVQKRPEVQALRSFAHYTVTVDDSSLPQGVTLTRLAG
jgi:CRISPR-associated protein Csd2